MRQVFPVVILAVLVIVAAVQGGLDAAKPQEAIGIFLAQPDDETVMLKIDGIERKLRLAHGVELPELQPYQNVIVGYCQRGSNLQLTSIKVLSKPFGSEILAVENQAAEYVGMLKEGIVELKAADSSELIPLARQNIAFVVWAELASTVDFAKLKPGTPLRISYHFNNRGQLVLVESSTGAGS